MLRLSILFVFLSILFIQFNFQQASSIYRSTYDELEDTRLRSHPSSSSLLDLWYNRLNDFNDNNDIQEDMGHVWKRYSPELTQLRQRRRFGNTRYGRSLSNTSK